MLNLLKENKDDLGLGDIRYISPTIIQHRIHLEENAQLTKIDNEGGTLSFKKW